MNSGKKSPGPRQVNWEGAGGAPAAPFPWGPHRLPLQLRLPGIEIDLVKDGRQLLYRRFGPKETVEKTLLAESGSLSLNPVEPLHLPPGISAHLMVELETPVLVEPRSSRSVLLTFPLELACIYSSRDVEDRLFDVFSFHPPKFTLYGGIKTGLVCKYWRSKVFSALPLLSPAETGVIGLEINNAGGRWSEVMRVVFAAHGMKIYYGPGLVSLEAGMKIGNEMTAETFFYDRPHRAGMRRAPEQFGLKLLGQPGRMLMEEGY